MSAGNNSTKYKGVRMWTWGKWVSEIRVPGTSERLWLGSYSNPEAAAVAHDTAVYFLRGSDQQGGGYSFPERVRRFAGWNRLSPRSVQRVAAECGMEVDAELVNGRSGSNNNGNNERCVEVEQLEIGSDWNGLLFDDFDFQL